MNLAQVISTQKRAVLVVIALVCLLGIYAAFQLPTAIFPNTDFPRIVIVLDNGDVPADQMLATVTQPVEEAMNGIPGIVRIKSVTARGSADINLYFDWKVDVPTTLGLVQTRVSQITLPPTASVRRVDRLTFAVFPVAGYSLTSDTRDAASLRDIATYTIRPRLARLTGVANVAIAGGAVKEFHVEIDPAKLAARNVTLAQVTEAVKNSNIVASPGLIEENHQLELALVSGPAITFKINQQNAAKFGVSATDIAGAVTTAMSGDAASTILQQGKLITVRVGLPPEAKQSLETLKGLQIRAASGAQFRLDQVADIQYDKGQTEIERDGLRQSVAVTARITGSDLGTTITAIKAQLAKEVKLPAGMTLNMAGFTPNNRRAFVNWR